MLFELRNAFSFDVEASQRPTVEEGSVYEKKVIIDFYFFMSSSSSCEARREEIVCVFDENKFASSNLQLYVITAEKDFGSHRVSVISTTEQRRVKRKNFK